MDKITLTLPIYHTFKYKTKKDKVALIGMNNYRSWNPFRANEVKQNYHKIVGEALKEFKVKKKWKKFKTEYKIYYKNKKSDGNNIVSVIDKYLLDALQEYGVIENDTNENYLGAKWDVIEQDTKNPRIIVTIKRYE